MARFPWFALLAGLALLAERARPRRRRGLPGESERAATASDAAPAPGPVVTAATAALLLAALVSPAHAQSDWARGDAAFKAGRFAEAESLYARRARRGAPPALQLNIATARAKSGHVQDAAPLFDRLERDPRLGATAGYNLGTVLGDRGEIERGLEALRQALVRNPQDADARYNYEVLLRRQQRGQGQQSAQPPQPQPQPSPQPTPSAQSPSAGQQPQPGSPPPSAPQGQSPPPPAGAPQQMSRQQAERLLGSLSELERAEQQQRRRVRAVREKRGRDW